MITLLSLSDSGVKDLAEVRKAGLLILPGADAESRRAGAVLAALLGYSFYPDAKVQRSLTGARITREVYSNHRLLTRRIGRESVVTAVQSIEMLREIFPGSSVLSVHPSLLENFLFEAPQSSSNRENTDTLSYAPLVFLAGRGVGNRAAYERLKALAGKMGAEIACTRPVAMNNWESYDRFVGISGKALHAKLVVAFGVSGSGPLMQGLKDVERIAAVNTDKNALIFDYADYRIVKDLNTVMGEMEREYEKTQSQAGQTV